MASMVRVDEATHALLKNAAAGEGVSMQELLKRALEAYRRQRLLVQANAAYAGVRDDAEEYRAWRGELAALDGTLSDGLDPLPRGRKPGRGGRAPTRKRR